MSEVDAISSGGGGSGRGKRKSPWSNSRQLPPLGSAPFPVGMGLKAGATAPVASASAAGAAKKTEGANNGGVGSAWQAELAPCVAAGSCGSAGSSVTSDGTKAREGGGLGARKLELGSDASSENSGGGGGGGGANAAGGSGGGGKASMVNVDRDLQSKINAFTNAQKVLFDLNFVCEELALLGAG